MITIVDYGDECTQVVASSLQKITTDFLVSRNETDICSSDKIIFPGCGSPSAVMKKINLLNLHSTLRIVKKPMLGIGLGMQLMADYSKEGNFPCLGLFPGTSVKFENVEGGTLHKGMHKVKISKQSKLFQGIEDNSEFYFNNAYYLPVSELSTSTCQRDVEFCSSLESKNFFAVQFHPEMSGEVGSKLLKNFVEM
jgi:glutamine amidotransferase